MLVKQRHLSRIVGRRRWHRRVVGARVGRFSASNRRLDAVGGRVIARRPALLAAHIVERQHAGLSSPPAARLARLGIGTQEVAGVERDQLPERGQCRLLIRK